jgi:hypothetical protein
MATRKTSGATGPRATKATSKTPTPTAPTRDTGTHEHGDGHEHAPGHEHPARHVHGAGAGFDPACFECVIAGQGGHRHDWEHFPSDSELEAAGTVVLSPTASELARLTSARRFQPSDTFDARMTPAPDAMVNRLTDRDLRDLVLKPPPQLRDQLLRPAISRGLMRLIASYHRVRRNEATLTSDERARFNAALTAMEGNPAWQTLMAVHASGALYRIHSMHGVVGRERFLSWHRRYLFEAEQLLRTVDATLTIPYWDYVAGSSRPDWVHRPAGVTRPAPGAPGYLPTGSTIAAILARGDYSGFTGDLEGNAHNQVHNWCKGTLQNPATASYDPIFWMLHANVDRLWSVWQETHDDPARHTPTLSATDQVLDPWSSTVADVDDTAWDLGYRYG